MYICTILLNIVGDQCNIIILITVAPDAPGKPSAEVQTLTSATVKWTPPVSDGGSRITHYLIEYRMTGFFHWREEKTLSTSTSHTVHGLTKNSSYTFRVKAVNIAGESQPSDESDSLTMTPAGCKTTFKIMIMVQSVPFQLKCQTIFHLCAFTTIHPYFRL